MGSHDFTWLMYDSYPFNGFSAESRCVLLHHSRLVKWNTLICSSWQCRLPFHRYPLSTTRIYPLLPALRPSTWNFMEFPAAAAAAWIFGYRDELSVVAMCFNEVFLWNNASAIQSFPKKSGLSNRHSFAWCLWAFVYTRGERSFGILPSWIRFERQASVGIQQKFSAALHSQVCLAAQLGKICHRIIHYTKKKQFSPRDIHRICANERQGHQCHCSASQALLGLNVVSHHQRFHDSWPSQRDPIILKCFRHGWPMPSLELQSYSHPHRFPSDHAWKDFRMPTLPLIPATRCARNEVTAIAAIAQRCAHLTSNCFYPLWDHCVGLCRTRLIQNEMKK